MNPYVKAALNTVGFFAVLALIVGTLIYLFSTFGFWALLFILGAGFVAFVYWVCLDEVELTIWREARKKPKGDSDY